MANITVTALYYAPLVETSLDFDILSCVEAYTMYIDDLRKRNISKIVDGHIRKYRQNLIFQLILCPFTTLMLFSSRK